MGASAFIYHAKDPGAQASGEVEQESTFADLAARYPTRRPRRQSGHAKPNRSGALFASCKLDKYPV
jgi:hypothetical protein